VEETDIITRKSVCEKKGDFLFVFLFFYRQLPSFFLLLEKTDLI